MSTVVFVDVVVSVVAVVVAVVVAIVVNDAVVVVAGIVFFDCLHHDHHVFSKRRRFLP